MYARIGSPPEFPQNTNQSRHWEWNRWYERRIAAFLRGRINRGVEFVRPRIDLLYSEGRPVLFLSSLCGLAGTLLMPVGFSLTLPFFAAGFGAVILLCLIIECPASRSATGTADEFGKGPVVVPSLGHSPNARYGAEHHLDNE